MDMNMNEKELVESILADAESVSEGIEDISRIADEAGAKASAYVEVVAAAAAALRNQTCPHMRALVDDMEKAVKIKC